MDIKIKEWNIFDNNKLMWTLDVSKLDISEKELCMCIEKQIYNAGFHGITLSKEDGVKNGN